CGKENIASRYLMNRNQLEHSKYPWTAIVSLFSKKQSINITAAVINSRYVITVAAPFSIMKEKAIVYYNKFKRSDLVGGIEVEKIITHEKYRNNGKQKNNDIALLKLKDEIKFNDEMKPICLPNENMTEYENFNFTIASMGDVGYGLYYMLPENMQEIWMQIVDITKCEESYRNYLKSGYPYKLNKQMHICASSTEKHICRGDAGAALMHRHQGKMYALGIASFSKKICSEKPAVFTKVVNYLEWIKNNTKEGEYCGN
ncbi:clotting factor B-like isoform X1, partial [Leptotrombidium deliense]